MLKSMVVSLILLTKINAFAMEKNLSAHEHGSVKLAIAVEGNSVDFELDGPTESFINFEYLPKSPKEKEIFQNTKNLWNVKFLELISFDKNLNCKLSESSFNQVIDEKETAEEQAKIKDPKKKEQGVHSDILAKAKVICAKSVIGSEVKISLKKNFKNIKKLMAEILSKDTKSIEIKSESQIVKL